MSDTTISQTSSSALDTATVDALYRAIAHRRSFGVARLKADPVPRVLLERALAAADWAPSHGETEPWRFTVFAGDSRARLGEIWAAAAEAENRESGRVVAEPALWRARPRAAPVWISLGVQPALRPDGTLEREEEGEALAVACAVQNLHLVLAAEGLAGKWTFKALVRRREVTAALGLPAHARLLGFFAVGWPSGEWPEGKRRPLEEKVTWA